VRRLLRLMLGAAAAFGLALGVLLAALWFEHESSVELPAPSGPFAIGRHSEVWRDPSRLDPFAPEPARSRELLIWIWYPAAPGDRALFADYRPNAWRHAGTGRAAVLNLLWKRPENVHGHSFEDPPLAPGGPFPVIVFRSGLGALSLDYSTLAEDLASQG